MAQIPYWILGTSRCSIFIFIHYLPLKFFFFLLFTIKVLERSWILAKVLPQFLTFPLLSFGFYWLPFACQSTFNIPDSLLLSCTTISSIIPFNHKNIYIYILTSKYLFVSQNQELFWNTGHHAMLHPAHLQLHHQTHWLVLMCLDSRSLYYNQSGRSPTSFVLQSDMGPCFIYSHWVIASKFPMVQAHHTQKGDKVVYVLPHTALQEIEAALEECGLSDDDEYWPE